MDVQRTVPYRNVVLVAGIFICSPLIKKFGKRNIAFVGGFVALGGQVLFS